jgi:hypothetical protein
MANNFHICSTGINRLHGNSENTRTVEVEAGDFNVTPTVYLVGRFTVTFLPEGVLQLRLMDGTIIGTVPMGPGR